MTTQKTLIQKLAWVYAVLFFSVVVLGPFTDVNQQGFTFGVFKFDPFIDVLHFASMIWASFAAWHSTRYSIFYFRTFGALYVLDGIVGIIVGKGYLGLEIFRQVSSISDFGVRITANMPHILIGGLALVIGFIVSRKFISMDPKSI